MYNVLNLQYSLKEKQGTLTTQADCTASETLPALGSHQNTWHWKCWFPVSMMKANVWTSRPTPMKDRNRTRHSTMTSSSSSCPNRREMTIINPSVRCHHRPVGDTLIHQTFEINVNVPSGSKRIGKRKMCRVSDCPGVHMEQACVVLTFNLTIYGKNVNVRYKSV